MNQDCFVFWVIQRSTKCQYPNRPSLWQFLSSHPIRTRLQFMLKIISKETFCLLWPGVFVSPLVRIVWNRHSHVRCRSLGWLVADMVAEPHDLVQDHLSHLLHVFHHFKGEVESLGAGWFVGRVVPDVKISMFQSILNRDTRRGIECQHAIQQVEGVRIGLGKQPLERNLRHIWEISDIFLGTRRANSRQGLFVGRTQVVQDLVELVDVVTALEEGSATEQFGQNTSNRPHIDWVITLARVRMGGQIELTRFGVALEAQHDFRGTVPTRRDVFRHVPGILLGIL